MDINYLAWNRLNLIHSRLQIGQTFINEFTNALNVLLWIFCIQFHVFSVCEANSFHMNAHVMANFRKCLNILKQIEIGHDQIDTKRNCVIDLPLTESIYPGLSIKIIAEHYFVMFLSYYKDLDQFLVPIRTGT